MKIRVLILCVACALSCIPTVAQTDSTATLDGKSIDEVTVSGRSIKQSGDRTNIFITKEMRRGKTNTGEILGDLPGFYYDMAFNTLTFGGSSNIMILVDSLEKDNNFIKNLQHVRFDKIEIIHQPQGLYSGYDVLINLHTKEDYEGYEGMANSWTGFCLSDANDATVIFSQDNGYFTYTKNKWNFYGNFGYNFNEGKVNNWSERYYPMNGIRNTVVDNADGSKNTHFFDWHIYGQASADYTIDKNRSLSFVYAYGRDVTDNNQNRTVNRVDENMGTDILLNMLAGENSKQHSHSFGAFFRNNSGKVKYNVDFNYRYTPSHNRTTVNESTGYTLDNNFRDRTDYTRFRMYGWTQMDSSRLTLNFGYTNTWKKYKREAYVTGEELNSNSYFRNYLYAGFNYKMDNGMQFGLTGWAEHIHVKSNSITDNQMPFGGRAMIFYRMSKKNWMRLNYNCSVSYPDFNLSSEYGYFTDSLTWTGGNPLLKTSVTHDLRYWIDLWWCFNFQTGVIYSPNSFASITELREGTLSTGQHGKYAATIWQNTKYQEWWASVSVTKRLWRDFIYKFDLKYSTLKSSYGEFSNSARGINISTSLNYYNSMWDANFKFYYSYTRRINLTPQSKSVSDLEYPYLSIQKNMFKKRLSISLQYVLFFRLFNNDNRTDISSPAVVGWNLDKIFDRQRDRIVLGITYRFSGGKTVRQYNREMSNEK